MFNNVFSNITQDNYLTSLIIIAVVIVALTVVLSFVKKHLIAAIITVCAITLMGTGLVADLKASSEYIENDIKNYITKSTTDIMNNATSDINDISIDSSKINLN